MLYSFINYKYETEREDHGRGSVPYLKLHAAVEWFCFSCFLFIYPVVGVENQISNAKGGTMLVYYRCRISLQILPNSKVGKGRPCCVVVVVNGQYY